MRWTEKDWWKGARELIALRYLGREEGASWHWLHLRKTGSRIDTIAQETDVSTETLLQKLVRQSRTPIVVSVGPEHTLQRLLGSEQASHPLPSMLGPNARQEDFALQLLPASAGMVSAAAIRVDVLSNIMGLLAGHRLRVIGVTFHPLAWALLGSALVTDWETQIRAVSSEDGEDWFVDGLLASKVDLNGRKFVQHSLAELASYMQVETSLFLAWVAAVICWTDTLRTEGWNVAQMQRKDFTTVSVMQKMAGSLACMLLAMALALFSLQWQGNRRKALLEQQYLVGAPVIGAIDSMRAQVERRAELLASLGESTLRPSQASRVLDRIGGVVPKEVSLTELVIGPTTEELKKLGVDSIPRYNLLLRGKANDSWPVSKFGKRLEEQQWVETVHVWGSEMNFRTGDHEFTFLLKLKDAG